MDRRLCQLRISRRSVHLRPIDGGDLPRNRDRALVRILGFVYCHAHRMPARDGYASAERPQLWTLARLEQLAIPSTRRRFGEVHMRSVRGWGRLTGSVAIAVVVSCSCRSSNPRAAASPESVTTTFAAPHTTTVPRRSAFTLDRAGLTAMFIPPGFVPVKTPVGRAIPGYVTGPGPGWTNDGQQFWNTATKQLFIISVSRGRPIGLDLAPNQVTPPRPGSLSVSGHRTYVRTEALAEPEREFTWIIGPRTSGFVGGFNMTDDALLRIANGLRVAT
jgi:hypothetical protein